jgi:hypothetical protein
MPLNEVRGGKIIKHVIEKNYEIALYELTNGKYVIGIDIMGDAFIGEPMTDLGLANFVFDQKKQALEGH